MIDANILLNVKSTQAFIGEQPQVIDFTTEGKIFKDNGRTIISYDESELIGTPNHVTRLEIGDDFVEMHRLGENKTKMLFKAGQRNSSLYNTEFGTFKLELVTENVDFELNEKFGKIDIRYDLSIKNLTESQNTIEINYRPIGNA